MTLPVQGPVQGAPSRAGSSSIAPPAASELLHAVTLRPPGMAWNGTAYTGARLSHLDTDAARNTPGVVDIVVRQDFIGIIASQPGQAQQARSRLQPGWAMPLPAPEATAASHARLGSNNTPHGPNEERISHTYFWPAPRQQAPAWAIAHRSGDTLVVWTHTRHSEALRRELAQLCGLAEDCVRLIANGQTDSEGYDVAVDAALLSRSCGRPVRVQQDPDTFNTKPVSIEVSARPAAGDTSQGQAGSGNAAPPAGELLVSASLHAGHRPSIAAMLCGYEAGQPPAHIVRIADYAPQARHAEPGSSQPYAGMLGLPAAAQVFAQESFFDEACGLQGRDPVQARLDAIDNATGRELIASVAERAKWSSPRKSGKNSYEGRGFAYAHVIDQTQQPPREVWSAWVADIRVDPATGAIDLTGLTVGHNAGALQTPSAPRIEEDVRRAAARWLQDASGHDSWGATADADFPLAQSATQVQLVEQGPVGLAWSHDAELPAAAAIANAIHDATGIRLRQPPFDSGELKQRLALAQSGGRAKKTAYALLGGMAAAAGSLLVAAMPWRPAIAPVANVDTSIYSAAAIERGRLVAAGGDCMVCHTAEGGVPNAGGLALETPFGKIYTTNITPDKETGIGAWSYAAFERAMREGIHRDGRHLYPAFPYTAFAKISDADMQSLYAYLMTQEPVKNRVEPTQLPFPYSARPLLAGWNLLFHKNETYQPDSSQSTLWNRGAYLVQGMGHCAACHSPRNALGAEKSGEQNFLAGGFAEGWEAPALNALSKAPIPWTEDELYRYLRTGYSSLHGVASGPMAPVVQSMAELPDQDVRAIAHYLGTLAPAPSTEASPALQAARLEEQSRNDQRVLSLAGENLFQGACAVCHDAREGPPLFGARPSLALNTNLHSDSPDNAIQILLHGIDNPAMAELGYMPGFGDSMNDQQLETLLEYLRMRFAPDKPAWEGLSEKIRSLREGEG